MNDEIKQMHETLEGIRSKSFEAMSILGRLVACYRHKKMVGEDDDYRKQKEGLWEEACAFFNLPFPMEIKCLMCRKNHIDKDMVDTPHRDHTCHYCGMIIRSLDVEGPTVGIDPIPELFEVLSEAYRFARARGQISSCGDAIIYAEDDAKLMALSLVGARPNHR